MIDHTLTPVQAALSNLHLEAEHAYQHHLEHCVVCRRRDPCTVERQAYRRAEYAEHAAIRAGVPL